MLLAHAPSAIGVRFSASALTELPTPLSDGHRCFDANNDRVIDTATECSAWHERVLPVPSEASRRSDVPLRIGAAARYGPVLDGFMDVLSGIRK